MKLSHTLLICTSLVFLGCGKTEVAKQTTDLSADYINMKPPVNGQNQWEHLQVVRFQGFLSKNGDAVEGVYINGYGDPERQDLYNKSGNYEDHWLMKVGEEGWEMFQVIVRSDNRREYYFKRPKN